MEIKLIYNSYPQDIKTLRKKIRKNAAKQTIERITISHPNTNKDTKTKKDIKVNLYMDLAYDSNGKAPLSLYITAFGIGDDDTHTKHFNINNLPEGIQLPGTGFSEKQLDGNYSKLGKPEKITNDTLRTAVEQIYFLLKKKNPPEDSHKKQMAQLIIAVSEATRF